MHCATRDTRLEGQSMSDDQRVDITVSLPPIIVKILGKAGIERYLEARLAEALAHQQELVADELVQGTGMDSDLVPRGILGGEEQP